MSKIRVVVWNENVHESKSEAIRKVYPNEMYNYVSAVFQPVGCIERLEVD